MLVVRAGLADLMREAIRDHQRSSEASEVIGGNQRSSEVVKRSSEVIRGHQIAIRAHQRHHRSSAAINLQSELIQGSSLRQWTNQRRGG